MRKHATTFIVLLMATLLVGGFVNAVAEAAEEPKWGGTLTVAVGTNPRNIDPRLQWDSSSQQPLSNIVDRFFTVGEDFNYRPLLAESWSYNEEGTEYTFYLRRGAKFHDGTDVTAEVIRDNILFTADAANQSPQITFWETLDSVEAPDPYTLVIKLTEPVAPATFLSRRLDSPWPLAASQANTPVNNPISTGPFKFVSYTGDDQVVMERFDDYWGGAPYLDRVIFRVIPDPGTRRVEIERGTVDVLLEVDPKDVAGYERRGLVVMSGPAPFNNMISFNVASGPLSERAVREAIAYAIDRDALIERVFYGFATKATTFVHEQNVYHNSAIPSREYDVAKARLILDEAGWVAGRDGYRSKNGERLHLTIASRNDDRWNLMSQVLQQYLADIGIDSTIVTTDTSAFYDSVRGGNYDLAYWSLSGSSWTDLGHPNLGSADWGNIAHLAKSTPELQEVQREIDRLINGFESALDEDTRRMYSQQLQEVVYEHVITVPLWFEDKIIVMQPHVRGIEAPSIMRTIRLEKAWLDK